MSKPCNMPWPPSKSPVIFRAHIFIWRKHFPISINVRKPSPLRNYVLPRQHLTHPPGNCLSNCTTKWGGLIWRHRISNISIRGY